MLTKLLLAGAILFMNPVSLFAQSADCEKLLIPDQSFTKKDISIELSYLSRISQSNFEQHKMNGNFSGSMPMAEALLKGSASFEEFSQKREEKLQEYQFNYSYKDLSTYYVQTLPQERAALYLQCVNPYGLRASISFVDTSQIGVFIEWHPAAGQVNAISLSPNQVTLKGGTVAGKLPKSFPRNVPRIVTFNRTPGEDFRFTANPSLDALTIFVPKHRDPLAQLVTINMEAINPQSGGWVTMIHNAQKRTRFRIVGKWYNHHPTSIVSAAVGLQFRVDEPNGKEGVPINNDMTAHWLEIGQSAHVRVSDPELKDNDLLWESPDWRTLFKDQPNRGPLRYIVEQ
ncbi:MAG: hypothetical protein JSS38_18600 [Nitrospira sp.]|nr:hypothetical protein [Nitrospira sp.]